MRHRHPDAIGDGLRRGRVLEAVGGGLLGKEAESQDRTARRDT